MSSHLESFKNRSDLNLKNERQIIELNALFEVSNQLSSSLKLSDILNNTLFLIMGRMLISKAAIFLKEETGFKFIHGKGVSFPEQLFSGTIEQKKPYRSSEFSDILHTQLIHSKLDLIIPIHTQAKTIGFFALGKKLTSLPFETDELNFLESVCSIAGTSIQNALTYEKLEQSNRALDEKVHQLETLLEVGNSLNETLDFNEITKTFSRILMGQFLCASHAIIYVQDEVFVPVFSKNLHISEQDLDLFSKPETLTKKAFSCSVEYIVPLKSQGYDGFVLLGKKMNGLPYTQSEKEFLKNLANSATAALNNAVRFKESIEKQKLEEELNLAKKIQVGLLPKEMPCIDGVQIKGSNQTSKTVGGDYFDFIEHPDNKLGIAIGDVSGKGAAAALLMSNLQASMHAITRNRAIPVEEQIAQANSIIYKNTSPEKYITFFYGELDPESKKFTYVNAGHNFPLIYRNGEFLELRTGGIILGMMDGMEYSSETIQLKKGDVFILYTDGINEAMNDDGEEFEMDRFYQVIKETTRKSAEEIHDTIIERVFQFAPNANESDDITLITVKVE